MKTGTLEQLKTINNIDINEDGDLSTYTGFRTGGRSVIIDPHDKNSFTETVNLLKTSGEKYYILGNGSNVLAKDEGYDGIVVLTKNALSSVCVEGEKIKAGAGVLLSEVCKAALCSELTGLEFAYGIPGSVGGAVFMNAGAYGGEMKDIISSVEYLNESGQIETLYSSEIQFDYRNSVFHQNRNWTILTATFSLSRGIKKEIEEKMLELLKRRKEKQPLEFPSCGSTFKRPVGNYASKLIDECGFRGFTVGGAQVSEKHCGFVINRDNATTKDILDLISIIKKTVQEMTGYVLDLEVEILE